ncbi:glycine oxidase ThiO [Pseudomonas sp. PDM16]|uniref:glycine oxidase ThiO n=1 Tax=Pseudomonas sp. PDM16 TaxID=2769292 RepID=UPI00298D2CE9|nr:glycine oxidase ThiO [Pseudomonas sp. PDM16]
MDNIIVIGGGAIGLLSALNLAQQGLPVTLLEQSETGQEASWAGGGIISPLYPWRYSQAVTALSAWSQSAYPELATYLLKHTGIDPELHTTGLYWLDLEDEVAALEWAAGSSASLLAPPMEEVHVRVPSLGSGFSRSIYMPGVASIRNPQLLRALKQALLNTENVSFREHCTVTEILLDGAGNARGVLTSQGEMTADHVVVAAGAWSARLLSGVNLDISIEPVKGQMILYKCSRDFLPCIVLANGRYAIPRRDGHILVGSTIEHTGFDKTPTDEALSSLKASAEILLPALSQAEIIRHWGGLRPGSPQGIPYIGAVPGIKGLWLNCGHYRNGLVLAPASCRLLADLMLGRPPIVAPESYSPPAPKRP